MDVLEAIQSRRSIRKYQDIPVEWEKIGRIVEAGMAAPSAGNLQDVKFVIVLDEAKRSEVAKACLNQVWMSHAPVHLVICADFTKTARFYGLRGERLYTIQNSAAAIENVLLAAHAFGLGACWVGAFNEDLLKSSLGIPDYARPQAVIAIGYPDEIAPPPAKLKLEHCVFINSFGNKLWNPYTEALKDTAPIVQEVMQSAFGALKGGTNRVQQGSQALGEKLAGKAKELAGKLKKKD